MCHPILTTDHRCPPTQRGRLQYRHTPLPKTPRLPLQATPTTFLTTHHNHDLTVAPPPQLFVQISKKPINGWMDGCTANYITYVPHYKSSGPVAQNRMSTQTNYDVATHQGADNLPGSHRFSDSPLPQCKLRMTLSYLDDESLQITAQHTSLRP